MAAGDERVTLETFDGSDVSTYRRWKRGAQLMLAAMPNTVPKEKYGPHLLQYIKGEAELVCEAIPVEKLCQEGGDKLVFELLDEKYGPQPTDLLHRALKDFFYDLQVKSSESFQQFQARYFYATQKLEEQEFKSSTSSSTTGKAADTNVVETDNDVFVTEDAEVKELLQRFSSKKQAWEKRLATDVGNPGFADSHSTGNRQRPYQWRSAGHGRWEREARWSEAPADIQVETRSPAPEVFCQRDVLQDVLSSDAHDSNVDFDPALARCGVPDTACRPMLVGEYILGLGLRVKRVKCRNRFRFGNSGALESEEVAIIPAKIGSKVICVKASVLNGHGSRTPLLLSKELLRSLGAVMDMSRDQCHFRHVGETVVLRETNRGHYGIPMFEAVNVEEGRQHHG